MGPFASFFAEMEQRLAEEVIKANAMHEAKSDKEMEKGRKVTDWNSRMSYVLAVQRASDKRSGTTVPSGELGEK